MAGQIIKRSEQTWLIRVFTGRDGTGKRCYFNKTIHGTKKEADKYLRAKLREQDLGVFVEPAAISLDEYLDKWLHSAARPRLRERTFGDYKQLLKRYVSPSLGQKRLCDLRPLDIQSLYTYLAAPKLKKDETPQKGVIYGLGLSARSIRYTHAILSSALKQAIKWHMLAVNPCAAVELPRMTRREMNAFSPEEAGAFLKAAADDEQGIIFAFALATGMRPEEYLALKWSDIELEQGTAIVQRTLVFRKGGGWYFGEPKTSRSRRTVPLPASIVRALAAHRREQMAARLKAGTAYQSNDLVFATGEGTPHNLRNLTQRHFQSILTRAKLPAKFRVYDLRHSCATLLLVAGENPKVVSERLGHASIVLTLDTYSHVLPSMQQSATEKLESILYSKTGTQ
jgi:integrase